MQPVNISERKRFSIWRDGHFIRVEHLIPEEVKERRGEGYQVYRIYGQPGVYDE